MKYLIYILALSATLASCKKEVVKKPDNLIPEDKMVDIIYDLAILEAIRTQKPMSIEQNNLDPRTYVYRKYQIDSVQFAASNKFYAGDVGRYKRIYETVDKRLETQKAEIDKQLRKSGTIPGTTGDEPIVR